MVGLCDCNNFFVSCQRVFAPDLEGKPVVVLSNNDGCVIARSNEAKALGIKMAQPFFQIQRLVEGADVKVFSSNYELYGDMSQRVFSTLRTLCPDIEVYSIDEAFIDFEGVDTENIEEYCRGLVRKIRRNTGIPVSIGIAPTKTLAKIASKLCKTYPKLRGACFMHRTEDVEKVLKTYPINDIWGIGRRYSKMLDGYAITTALDFYSLSEEWVRSKMGVVGVRTHRELHGIKSIDFEPTAIDRQSLTVSRSFAHEITEYEELRRSLTTFIATAMAKLRAQKSVVKTFQIFIATNRFRVDAPQYSTALNHEFIVPTSSTIEVTQLATRMLEKIFIKGYGYKKAGVTLLKIAPENSTQRGLFDPEEDTRHNTLFHTVDAINEKLGRDTIKLASQGAALKNLNRDHISPLYSTKWDDIITVKV